MTDATTPLMQQYHAIKTRYPHALLLFRLGDFYELFYEDAKIASQILGITLTSRAKGDDRVPMAGVPYHAARQYIARLEAVTGARAAIVSTGSERDATIVRNEILQVVG